MLNFFELFDLPQRFAINEADLKKRFLALQKTWHPDNFAAKSEKEKAEALLKSADINEGFETLKNPATRAAHLLALKGAPVDSDNRAMPQEFLAEQFALHEALDDAKTTHNTAQLETLLESVELFELQRIKNLEKFLDSDSNGDSESNDSAKSKNSDSAESQKTKNADSCDSDSAKNNLSAATENLTALLFLQKLKANIESALE